MVNIVKKKTYFDRKSYLSTNLSVYSCCIVKYFDILKEISTCWSPYGSSRHSWWKNCYLWLNWSFDENLASLRRSWWSSRRSQVNIRRRKVGKRRGIFPKNLRIQALKVKNNGLAIQDGFPWKESLTIKSIQVLWRRLRWSKE